MMLSSSSCKRQHPIQCPVSEDRAQSRHHQHNFRGQTPCGLLLLIILVSWTGICQGAPFSSNMLRAEQELQLWNGIEDVCSAVLSDSQPAVSSGLEEICFMVMGILQRSQGSDEKDDSKRFLFHYSKSHDSGTSNITVQYDKYTKCAVRSHLTSLHSRTLSGGSPESTLVSSVVHPLLQLVPQLYARKMKRFNSKGVLNGLGAFSSRSANFQYKARNGRRSPGFR